MTRIAAKQLPQKYRDVIEEQVAIFARHRTIEKINKIPDTADIPIEDPIQGIHCHPQRRDDGGVTGDFQVNPARGAVVPKRS